VEHTWQQADLSLGKVMEERCKLVIALRAETPKAGRGTRCGGLIGRVRSGEGTSRSRCRP
jgi:hypothetical protein